MSVTVWFDMADMRTKVKTSAGIMLDETGRPTDIAPYEDFGKNRWKDAHEAVAHFARVDAKLRSL